MTAARWLRVPTAPAGPCKSVVRGNPCEHSTVRLRGLLPVTRPETEGGFAGLRICPVCDGVLPGPVAT